MEALQELHFGKMSLPWDIWEEEAKIYLPLL